MKLFELPSCPYCNKKVNFIAAWILRREGEFRCPRCRGISNIMLDIRLAFIAAAAVLLSALLFIILHLVCKMEGIGILILSVLPIIIFYILSIFFVRLKKPVMKKKRRKTQRKTQTQVENEWTDTNEIESTKIN